MRVCLIADAAIDCFVNVECSRLAPEGPWPCVVPHSIQKNPGMGGNVMANIQSLAPKIELVTLFPSELSVKTRYVDRKTNHHFLRVDQDAITQPFTDDKFLHAVKTTPDMLILSDYNKGFLTTENMNMVAKYGYGSQIPVFADTKGLLGDWSKPITIVKINEVEFQAQLKAGVKPWKECQNLIVTRGGKGMDWYNQDGVIIHHEDSIAGDVVDAAGAGDTALAALAISYLETGDIKKAINFAVRACAVAVSKRGVVAVKREEVI